jgi:hypothetical protein
VLVTADAGLIGLVRPERGDPGHDVTVVHDPVGVDVKVVSEGRVAHQGGAEGVETLPAAVAIGGEGGNGGPGLVSRQTCEL